ncbi:lysosomal alpha-mannosidase-like isoform X2 [Biomphalaria glabrata]|uniref:Alpha-mannosidase n=1 Tax=Biomphalaria glabrata TaxID=6526 RepID=A0A9W2ZL52_BIOGL|nr:lysosomal alpha-mannosidase-like isoform X2 [Biomphalaria glabrata]
MPILIYRDSRSKHSRPRSIICKLLFTQLFITYACCRVVKTADNCGYESCNLEKPGMINVHLVPHTHDDVGWLMTVDQYYYKEVQFILDGVIPELAADPNKRFIYVEIAFFSRWFNEQNDATRHLVQKLVNEGRLEFILGGWCMNDEATPHYTAMIDQHKLGFEYLRNNFGDCARPKIGWQIDPFGHSREQASLFAQFGFDGYFFGRLDYQDKDKRQKDKTMEFVWRASPNNLGIESNIFTGVLPNGYGPPGGYCFDIRCDPNMIQDDPRLHDYNVEQMVDGFINAVNDQAKSFRTNHLIMTMGSDFNYIQAHMFFKEMDKLIQYVNARQDVGSTINLLYSTPSCYLKQLNNDNLTWTTKDDDFFPYADREHGFWTGYFTSRPALKRYVNVVNSFFQSVKQMAALAKLDNTYGSGVQLQHLAEVLGVAQHHDAVSGTEKQAVTFDYAERLADGVNSGQSVVQDVYNSLMSSGISNPPLQIFCLSLNVSVCNVSQSSSNFQITLYNPLVRSVFYTVRLPVFGSKYIVYKEDGSTIIPSDVLPIPTKILKNNQVSTNELIFLVQLPPLGFVTYFVQAASNISPLTFESEKEQLEPNDFVLQGKYVSVTFDESGNLHSITNLTSGTTLPLLQNFMYYSGFPGNNSGGQNQASGAYIFRPSSNTPTYIPLKRWGGIIKGSVVQEAFQQFTDWISQVIRVYQDKPYVEIEWTIGPIPIDDKIGKEIVTRYTIPGFGNKGVFYTDANGREVLERRLNYRPTWDLNQTEPVAGNYYPVNALIGIKNGDSKLQFTVLTDRSQGGVSLNDGDVELMVHRRLLYDDAKGVGEPLNEPGDDGKGLIIKGTHYLVLDSVENSASIYRPLAQQIFWEPQVSFSDLNIDPASYVKKFKTKWSGLASALPRNVHLLTMEQFRHTGPVPSPSGSVPYLIRFEHFYENYEDDILSAPVTFDIKDIFAPFQITDVYELSLGGNVKYEDVHRLQWKTEASSTYLKKVRHLSGTQVTLKPMEIVTLQANIFI